MWWLCEVVERVNKDEPNRKRRERECKEAVNRNESQRRKLHVPCSWLCVCSKKCVVAFELQWYCLKIWWFRALIFLLLLPFYYSSSSFGSILFYTILAIVTVIAAATTTHQYHYYCVIPATLSVNRKILQHTFNPLLEKCCTEMRRNRYHHYDYGSIVCLYLYLSVCPGKFWRRVLC